ncbi:MAG: hypothetical protein ABR552_09870 [Actinomycetota bacterium]
MPKLDFAFLADAAEAEPGRKFYVIGGGVDSITAPSFPVVHPHLSLVLRIMIHPAEADRDHTLEVRMMDSDGGALANVAGTFAASGTAAPGREVPVNLVFNMVNTRFEGGGDYSIEILINNEHKKSLPLRLVQFQPPA